jgi:hypothetical protein
MDVSARMDAPCPPPTLFALVDGLTDYPRWMPLAHRVEPVPPPTGEPPAWIVELRARVGPFARSKRLRMVRTVHDVEGLHARFERDERDGRRHSPWVLDARVTAEGDGCRLDMHLHYGGALWSGGLMERVLADQIVAGRERLLAMVRSSSTAEG